MGSWPTSSLDFEAYLGTGKNVPVPEFPKKKIVFPANLKISFRVKFWSSVHFPLLILVACLEKIIPGHPQSLDL